MKTTSNLADLIPKRSGRSKYGAKRTIVDGITFHSRAEAARWIALHRMYGNVQRQVVYKFACGAKYIADFVYRNPGNELVVEDVKGVRTANYRLKKKLMKHEHGIEITEVKMDSRTVNVLLASIVPV